MDHDLDSLLSLEDTFYQEGLASGQPHGELHGLFEGRALGREKCWELWEEVGYYEGAAQLWKAVLVAQGKQDSRAFNNIEILLTHISTFPTTNDSTLVAPAADTPDISALIVSIRTKYRTVCAGLGVRPRLVAAGGKGGENTSMSL